MPRFWVQYADLRTGQTGEEPIDADSLEQARERFYSSHNTAPGDGHYAISAILPDHTHGSSARTDTGTDREIPVATSIPPADSVDHPTPYPLAQGYQIAAGICFFIALMMLLYTFAIFTGNPDTETRIFALGGTIGFFLLALFCGTISAILTLLHQIATK